MELISNCVEAPSKLSIFKTVGNHLLGKYTCHNSDDKALVNNENEPVKIQKC